MTCTTHHHACDCREAAHTAELAALRLQVERMRDALQECIDSFGSDKHDHSPDCHECQVIERARAALAQPEKETPKPQPNDDAIIARFLGGPM